MEEEAERIMENLRKRELKEQQIKDNEAERTRIFARAASAYKFRMEEEERTSGSKTERQIDYIDD